MHLFLNSVNQALHTRLSVDLLDTLSSQVQANTVVVDESSASLGGSEQRSQESSTDEHVGMCGNIARVDSGLGASSDVPAVQVDNKDNIVDQGVRDRHLNSGHHSALLLACRVLLPRTTVLLDHANELDIARHDCWDGGD